MRISARRPGGTALGALLWILSSLACRPAPAPPVWVHEPAPAPWPRVAVAPAIPLAVSLDLSAFVTDQIENFYAHRADLLGKALEPEENGLNVELHSTRMQKDFEPIEAYFNSGEELFEFDFRPTDGLGDGMSGKPPNMHRVHRGAHGGPDTTSCRSCHHRGGDDGAGEYPEAALTGGDGINTYHSNERNPPALLGGGAMQILAKEITEELGKLYQNRSEGMEYERDLTYQDVNFGTLKIRKDGSMDTGKITSLDPDLVVRPFGWKGTHSTLRRFAEEAFQVHHGMQSDVLIEHRRIFGPMPRGTSPATLAVFDALGDGPDNDPDRDGQLQELHDGFLLSISVYLTLLPLPVIDPPRSPDLLAAFRDGEAAFREVGCADCHKPFWILKDPTWKERGETAHTDTELLLDLRKDIHRGPKLRNTDTLFPNRFPLFIFSDLRRHDMGPELADTYRPSGGPHPGDHPSRGPQIPPSYFLTRPLWGLADSGPYLHDGRATTIPEAIIAHGGEAAKSREAYLKLPVPRQRAMHVFLLSLTRPPVPEVVP